MDLCSKGEDSAHAMTSVDYFPDADAIYTVEDGYFMRKITFSTIKSDGLRYRILYLDKYYDNPKNRNNLYK